MNGDRILGPRRTKLVATLVASPYLLIASVVLCSMGLAVLYYCTPLGRVLTARQVRDEMDLDALRCWADTCLQSNVSGSLPREMWPDGLVGENRVMSASVERGAANYLELNLDGSSIPARTRLYFIAAGSAPPRDAHSLAKRIYWRSTGGHYER